MANPVGFRFRPTDEEIVNHYLRLKNLGINTTHVDEVINTVDICSFDPWDLPSQSKIEERDKVWYFFSSKEYKYNRGDRQNRKTKSGFWKKTGQTMDIMRKRGNREKIGEKRVLMFYWSKVLGGSKSDWVMHEYHATPSSPNQMIMTYTICKVEFKGEETEISYSSSSGIEIENTHSLIPHMNNSGGLSTEPEASSFHSQEFQNPGQLSGVLDVQEEAQIDGTFIPGEEEWESLLVDDDVQEYIMLLQDDRNDYRPQKSVTGVFIDHSSDDDSDLTSARTSSFQNSSTCDSFGSANHSVDQIKDLQESSTSTIELVSLTRKVSKLALGTSINTSKKKNPNDDDAQGSEVGEHKLGQETVKNKRAGFFNRIIQKFIKKLRLCSSITIEHDINN